MLGVGEEASSSSPPKDLPRLQTGVFLVHYEAHLIGLLQSSCEAEVEEVVSFSVACSGVARRRIGVQLQVSQWGGYEGAEAEVEVTGSP